MLAEGWLSEALSGWERLRGPADLQALKIAATRAHAAEAVPVPHDAIQGHRGTLGLQHLRVRELTGVRRPGG